MANPNPKHKYTSPYQKPMAEQPLTVRVEEDLDKWVRSLPNRTEWLRKVIAEAAKAEMENAS